MIRYSLIKTRPLQGVVDNLMYTLRSETPKAYKVCWNLTTNARIENILSVKHINNTLRGTMMVEVPIPIGTAMETSMIALKVSHDITMTFLISDLQVTDKCKMHDFLIGN